MCAAAQAFALATAGELRVFSRSQDIDAMRQGRLLELVTGWLREEKVERKERERRRKEELAAAGPGAFEYMYNNGWAPGRLTSSIKESSNTVMRM